MFIYVYAQRTAKMANTVQNTHQEKKKKNEQQERQANIYAVVIMLNLVWNVPVIVKQEIQPGPACLGHIHIITPLQVSCTVASVYVITVAAIERLWNFGVGRGGGVSGVAPSCDCE